MDRSYASPWTLAGLYGFAAILVVSPFADLLTTVWPLQPGELTWRYGFLGLAAGYLHTPMLGLTLALGTAYWSRNATVLRGLGYAMPAVAAVLVVVMGVFLLDVLQMKDLRAEDARTGVLVGAFLQEAKYATAGIVLIILGVGATKTAKTYVREGAGRHAGAPGIVSKSR